MPETTVAAIASNAAGHILLTRRAIEPFQGQWCLPGGHIDRFEPVQATVVREVREETGLAFEPRFFGYFDEIMPEREIHAVVIVFAGSVTGVPRADAGEVAELAWFPLDQARALPLAFKHNAILDAYAESSAAQQGAQGSR